MTENTPLYRIIPAEPSILLPYTQYGWRVYKENEQPVALVSGSTGGIGSVIAGHLVAAGYAVIGLAPVRPGREIDDAWPLYQVDFTKPDHVARVMDDILAKHQRCDALVLAHGHRPVTTPSSALAAAEFRSVLDADVLGSFVLAQAAGRVMLQRQRGAIIFLSSLHARQTYPARAPYAAAKAAVCGMMRSLALEWGPRGVRVNALLPWQVAGPRSTTLIEAAQQRGEDLAAAYLARCPTGALVTPEDIAATVLWLLSTPSVHGAEVVLDGGVSASMWWQGYTAQQEGGGVHGLAG